MLTGDTVDNVPGVEKVGPKTAAKWLGTYKTVDSLVADADNIKGVAGQNLRKAIPDFKLTRQLLTIKTDCELSTISDGVADLVPAPADRQALLELYEQYGFRSWLRDLTGDPQRIPEAEGRPDCDPPG